MLVFFLIATNVFSISLSQADESPLVNITNGPIQGSTFTSNWTHQTIYAFQGIPYASPPTGSLRFKDPQPPENWTDTKLCLEDGPSCYQPAFMFNVTTDMTMSENCLFLNVYSPRLEENASLPVMVWIHGGAFIAGSGNYSSYGPDFLVNQGIVVVTLNYRLGPFGFLSLGIEDAPGNSGLKDQLLALRWVNAEISKFGGDPKKVTIFGESAGSASVHLHYVSPLSKGLFRGVIGDSGAGISSWAARSSDNSVFYALQLASLLTNSSITNVTEAHSILLSANAEDINRLQQLGIASPEDEKIGLALKFIPNVDGTSSKTPFLPEFPETLLEQGTGSLVPFLMGVNKDEGILGVGALPQAIANTSEYLKKAIPLKVRQQSSESEIKVMTEKIQHFYFNNTPVSLATIRGFLDLNTDTSMAYPTVKCARKYLKRGNVFLYYFTFDGDFKDYFTIQLETSLHTPLVAHAEELHYLFIDKSINQSRVALDSDERKTWERMVKMWTNFVILGAPTVADDPLLENITWNSVTASGTPYLWIDKNLTMMQTDFLQDRMELWDSLAASNSFLVRPGSVALISGLSLLMFRVENLL